MLRSQALSFRVVRAPVPGWFLVHSVMWLRKSGDLRVTVKDSQFDSGMRVQNFRGLPKLGFSRERRCQRAQEPSRDSGAVSGLETGRGAGGVVLVPRTEPVVIEPRVMITMSVLWIWTTPVMPFSMMWRSSTVVLVLSV